MQQPELTIHTVRVSELIPYVNNAKLHNEAQVDTIVASMQEFGNCDPIAVWHNAQGKPEIVEGHGRVLALKKLGIKEAPVIYLDHLTDEQRRAYTHVHNQTTLNSGIDFSKLAVDFDELEFDWNTFGFDASLELDWDRGTEELSEETYQEPQETKLVCPKCGHIDTVDRFAKK